VVISNSFYLHFTSIFECKNVAIWNFRFISSRNFQIATAFHSPLDTWEQGKTSAFLPSNPAWRPDGTIDGPAPNSLSTLFRGQIGGLAVEAQIIDISFTLGAPDARKKSRSSLLPLQTLHA
jgi:hypothetical protein